MRYLVAMVVVLLVIAAVYMLQWRVGEDGTHSPATSPRAERSIAEPDTRSGDPAAATSAQPDPPAVPTPATGLAATSDAKDWDIEVDVFGPDGRPAAGVSVSLFHRYEATSGLRWESVVSDESGVARFEGVGVRLLDFFETVQRHDTPCECLVRADLLLAEPREAVVPMTHAPATRPTLVLPETGRLVVEAMNVDGEVVSIEGPVWVQLENEQGWYLGEFGLAEGWSDDLGPCAATMREGRGVLDQVGLGLDLEVIAFRNAASYPVATRGPGPGAPGETATLRVEYGSDVPCLIGRAVDADANYGLGRALVRVELEEKRPEDVDEWAWGPEYRYHRLGEVRTDDVGRFRVDIAPELAFDGELRVMLTHAESSQVSTGGVPLSSDALAGVSDLGDIVLSPAPVLASGRVVDPAGNPIGGVTVTVNDAVRGMMVEEARSQCETNLEGRFELRGVDRRESFTVSFTLEAYPYRYVNDVTRGTRGLEVVMSRAGAIRGKLQLPEGASGRDFSASLEMTNWAGDGVAPNVSGGLYGDGGLHFERLEPGTWSVEIRAPRADSFSALARSMSERLASGDPLDAAEIERLAGGPEALVILEDVRVRGGETTDVGLIELPEAAFVHALAVSKNEEPVAGSFVVRPAGAARELDAFTAVDAREFASGSIRFVSEEPLVDVVIHASGCRIQVVRNVAAETEVEVDLEPALPVQLRLGPSSPLPMPPRRLAVVLVPSDVPGPGFGWGDELVRFDDSGEAVFEAAIPGIYDVHWFVGQIDEFGSSGTFLDEHRAERARIAIEDTIASQVFELLPPPEVATSGRDEG